MSQDRHERISEEAHKLWIKEGRPTNRELDHWLEAERTVDGSGASVNEGEGSRTAARAYNKGATDFAHSGKVEKQARKAAKDLEGPERPSLEQAEKIGRSHSRGEDPEIRQTKPEDVAG
jgi:hypothetical protein